MENNKQLSEKELEKVNAGLMQSGGNDAYYGHYHVGCGGLIMNILNPFGSCYCRKCNEVHYFANGFNKYQIYKTSAGQYYKLFDDDHIEYCDGKPSEIDEPCNQ